jgi:hypothetical protein
MRSLTSTFTSAWKTILNLKYVHVIHTVIIGDPNVSKVGADILWTYKLQLNAIYFIKIYLTGLDIVLIILIGTEVGTIGCITLEGNTGCCCCTIIFGWKPTGEGWSNIGCRIKDNHFQRI